MLILNFREHIWCVIISTSPANFVYERMALEKIIGNFLLHIYHLKYISYIHCIVNAEAATIS